MEDALTNDEGHQGGGDCGARLHPSKVQREKYRNLIGIMEQAIFARPFLGSTCTMLRCRPGAKAYTASGIYRDRYIYPEDG